MFLRIIFRFYELFKVFIRKGLAFIKNYCSHICDPTALKKFFKFTVDK